MVYNCVRCGKEFEASHKSMICSDCKIARCIICGNEFELKHPYTQQTCSSKCRGIYRKQSGIAKQASEKAKLVIQQKYGVDNVSELQKFKKICKWCGKEFETTSARREYCEDKHYGPCPVCGKQVEIKEMYIGPQACSEACRQVLIKNTCLERYGSTTAVNSEHAKELAKQTCLEKYGVDHYSKSDEYKEKVKQTSYIKYGTAYPMQNKTLQDQVAATNIKKYGGVSPMMNDEVKAKARLTAETNYGGFGMASPELAKRIKQTNMVKYGAANPLQVPAIREKIRRTMLERYRVCNPLQVQEFQELSKQTSLQRYGVEHPSQSDEIKQKVSNTVYTKYGVSNVFKSDEIKADIKAKMFERYGVENPMQNLDIQAKMRATNLERYGAESFNASRFGVVKRICNPDKVDEFLAFKQDPEQFIKQNYQSPPTLTEIARDTGVDITTISVYVSNNHLNDLIAYRKSNMERDLVRSIQSMVPDINIIRCDRTVIRPQELDIYLPDYDVAIECNPTVTHNSSLADPWGGQPKHYKYHQLKSYQTMDKGVFLFHIFGYEWTHRQEVILSMIENILGATPNRIYGRNTYVCEVSHNESIQFLDDNHRQGQTSAKVRLGLRLKSTDELVSLMTFNKLRGTMGKTDDVSWELSRFCNKLHTSVIGGASKLFKYFCAKFLPERVVSFSDVAHTIGGLYSKLGFRQVSESDPSYVWVCYSDDTYLHRVQCQKQHLKHLFGDPNLDIEHKTERELMEEHGYVRVFDSGVIRWEWSPNE